MNSHTADLLLLNASNYPGQPIYPYAFVQVSALARQRGLSVKRYDFLGTPRSEWMEVLRHLVETTRPRMIGVHVRQADSQILDDYQTMDGDAADTYFPVDDTKSLIEMARIVSTVPVVLGGFAISVNPQRICDFLQPDYAVYGAPNAFFEHFDALARRDLSSAGLIPNLIWKDGERYNFGLQRHFLPFSDREYDDDIFSDICNFYCKHGRQLSLGKIGHVDIPVEVMRGCPCQCYFCTEPSVKGKRPLRRNIDAVMEDVVFLAERDIRSVWFICSEINIYGMEFPLEIAARMAILNTELGKRRMIWKAYAMPRPGMSYDELRYMMSTGYVPGWNEFASFDDENLKACKMPYRTSHVVRYFKDILKLSHDPSIYFGPPLKKFEMFLGNAHMTVRAMRTTLALIDEEGFGEQHDFGGATPATRVYELGGELNCGSLDNSFSIGPQGRLQELNVLYPTFHQVPELLAALGGSQRLKAFLSFAASTLLSRNYRLSLDMLGFTASVVSARSLAEYLRRYSLSGLIAALHIAAARREEKSDGRRYGGIRTKPDEEAVERMWRNPSEERVRELYDPRSAPYLSRMSTLEDILAVLFGLNAIAFESVYKHLRLENPEDRKTPYRIMRQLSQGFETSKSLVESVCRSLSLDEDSLHIFQLKHFLYSNNVQFDLAYQSVMFEPIVAYP